MGKGEGKEGVKREGGGKVRKREEGREVGWKKKQYLEWMKTEESGVP